MARTPQVTRTIQTTKVNVLCLNILEGNPFNQTVVLPRTYKDDKAMLKAVEKVINSESVKAVHVVDSVVEETLYGMSEQKFIELATVLPPRKSTDKDDEDTETDGEIIDNIIKEAIGNTDAEAIAPVEGETVTADEGEIIPPAEVETATADVSNNRHNGKHHHNRNH